MTSRAWCFTIHVASFTDWNCNIEDARRDDVRFFVCQPEIAPTTGARHWQGFVRFTAPRSRGFCKHFLRAESAHCEISVGSDSQNLAYCTKSETRAPETVPYILGQPSAPNGRPAGEKTTTAVSGAIAAIAANPRVDVLSLIMDEPKLVPRMRDLFSIQRQLLTRVGRPIDREPYCRVLWGPTGTGKSRFAHESAPDAYTLSLSRSTDKVWFDGYMGEETVIIDDFRGEIPIAFLLRLLDRYPMRVEPKGDSIPLCATRWIITSNFPPRAWYPDLDSEQARALERRLTLIEHLDGRGHLKTNYDGQIQGVSASFSVPVIDLTGDDE